MKFNIKYSVPIKTGIQIFPLLLSLIFIAGCQNTVSSPQKPGPPPLSTTAGLIDYLQKLPAVESVDSWTSQYGQGLLITTAHYEIYTTLREPLMLRRIPAFVEAAYKGYQGQLPAPIPTNSKFKMYLFADRAQWEDFTKSFTGPLAPTYLKIKAGAYYLNGLTVVYNIGMTKTFSIIGHEGWHQFNHRHFRYRLPSWLDEGIATLFEAGETVNGSYKFEPSKNLNRLGTLRLTMERGKMLTVEQLIALNPGEVIEENNETAAAFYAQSYALVRFLREDNYGQRLGRYHQMLLGAVNGTWPIDEQAKIVAADRNIPLTVFWNRYVAAKLFETYISPDFGLINKQYSAFCGKIIYYIRVQHTSSRGQR